MKQPRQVCRLLQKIHYKSHEVNATGTLNLLESAVKANVKRIICASSSSVYGNVEYLPFTKIIPHTRFRHTGCPN